MKVPPTRWWHLEPQGERIVCDLCPRECRLQDGQRGFCFVRQNVGGKMVLTTYGRSTGFCIDPIEKKPLNHFLPGTPILSFGTAGCNLGCKFCQNWDISKSREIEILSQEATPEAICQAAIEHGCRSIAFTYNDPVIWAEYVIDTAKVAREVGLKTVAVTAGYITAEARADFYEYIDAVNVDLKAFTDAFYRSLTFASIEPVLDTLKWLKTETDVWVEVTNLLIPGENDEDEEVEKMCDWMLQNVGHEVPMHFTAFHPDFKMRDKLPTSPETLSRAREIAIQAGVRYAYVGNVLNLAEQSTYCPGCREMVIERDHYTLGKFEIADGKCRSCGEQIAGVFENERGEWGRKRLPISISSAQGSNGQGSNPDAVSVMTPVKTDFAPEEEQAMLAFARSVVDAAVLGNEPEETLSTELAMKPGFGMFVTLRRGKMLRACIGNWGEAGSKSIGELLRFSASASATNDHRFPSIHPRELPFLTVEISPMYDPQQIVDTGRDRAGAVKVGEHGLVITSGGKRGLLLPQVATENGWDEKTFLEQVGMKAGLGRDAWLRDDSKLMTFRGRHFISPPLQAELEIENLAKPHLQTLLEISDALLSNTPGQFQLPPQLTQPSQSPVGVVVETENGLTSTAIRSGASIPDLLKIAAANLIQSARGQGKEVQPTKRLLLLGHAIALQQKDYPRRFSMLSRSALFAQRGDKFSLQLAQPGNGDPIQRLLTSLGIQVQQWAETDVELLALQVQEVRQTSDCSVPSNVAAQPGIRSAAFAGKFYPGNEMEMNRELDAFFAWKRDSESKACRAIMLPHAGWRFCGDIIAGTIQRTVVPTLVVVIGPKHRQEGANWSVSAAKTWEVPGAQIPVDEAAADFLCSKVNLLRREDDAHRNEHGCEVLLPFLRRANPAIQIVPIAIGAADYDALDELSDAIRLLRKERGEEVLLVISSDLNHFATEEENRRLDNLALEQLKSANPRGLYDVCLENRISMCGMRPAVAVLKALLEEEGQTCEVEITKYETSARISKDRSKVVGYAGALLF